MLFWDICKPCELVNNRWRGRGIYNIGLYSNAVPLGFIVSTIKNTYKIVSWNNCQPTAIKLLQEQQAQYSSLKDEKKEWKGTTSIVQARGLATVCWLLNVHVCSLLSTALIHLGFNIKNTFCFWSLRAGLNLFQSSISTWVVSFWFTQM